MLVKLEVIAGPDKGQVFEFNTGDSLIVGRSKEAHCRLQDAGVSRSHFKIDYDGKQVRVTDFESRAGTLINGKRITKHEVREGDVIQAGNTQLRLVIDDPTDATTLFGPVPAPAPPVLPARQPKETLQKNEPAPPPPPAKQTSGPLAELVGKKLSIYQIDSLVARGHSSMVFRALNSKTTQWVALKVLQPDLSQTKEQKQRFVRAMKTMAPLHHPNLVTIYNAGKEGDFCWVAMELVEGQNLRQTIQQYGVAGQLDWRYAYRVAQSIGQALDYAHKHQVIHRNITPTNILIRSEDKLAKLSDLMLAKALEGTMAQEITKPGEVLGDVAYLSPEQINGSGEVDARSDIYGLGATLYTLLTGRPPFEAGGLSKLLMMIAEEKPKPPKEYQFSLPGTIEGLVLRMLDKRPENRFQNAGELLAELKRIGKVLNA